MMAKRKSKRSNGAEAWRKWHDPNATEADYARYREEHAKRVRDEAMRMIERALGNAGHTNPVAKTAAMSVLSQETVRKYAKKRDFGKRGPLLTTLIALRIR
jgi:hypothetical protein